MKTQMTVLALAATTLGILTGCKSDPPVAAPAVSSSPSPSASSSSPVSSLPSSSPSSSPTKTPSHGPTRSPSSSPSSSSSSSSSAAKIVYFKLVQKPRCPEGTAVYRAPAVPAIIKWKITGATSASLSVDDPTNSPGTYGPEPLSGTETFSFGCNGPVNSVEKHTYAIYTVGGGPQRSMTITATAKVIDDGKN